MVRAAVRGDSSCDCLTKVGCECDLGSPVQENCTPGSACSVRALPRKRQLRRGSAKATAPRPVPTSHRVNHDRLMAKLAERISDKRLLKLIRSFLQAGVMEDGLVSPVDEGTPQGGPLSPLLSNIVLDEFDRELERRKLRFARYADDSNIYVRSRRAGERVMKSVVRFIATRNRHCKGKKPRSTARNGCATGGRFVTRSGWLGFVCFGFLALWLGEGEHRCLGQWRRESRCCRGSLRFLEGRTECECRDCQRGDE